MPHPDLSSFAELEFPRDSEIVYVLCARQPSATQLHPFYVGQSSRSFGRIGDYQAAKFSAPTDFKVGQVVRLLRSQGLTVVVKYKASASRRADEALLLQQFREARVLLLNDVKGYKYTSAAPSTQIAELEAFAQAFMSRLPRAHNGAGEA